MLLLRPLRFCCTAPALHFLATPKHRSISAGSPHRCCSLPRHDLDSEAVTKQANREVNEHATVQFPDVNCDFCLILIPYRTFRGWDASPGRRIASMGQCEVQIKADGARAEQTHWKLCLIPLMHGFELAVCFRCGMPAAQVAVSFLLINCLVASD